MLGAVQGGWPGGQAGGGDLMEGSDGGIQGQGSAQGGPCTAGGAAEDSELGCGRPGGRGAE